MPLTFVEAGMESVVKKVRGKDDTCRFLASLGFIEGETVTVISKNGDDMIVGVKGSRIALSQQLANRIMI